MKWIALFIIIFVLFSGFSFGGTHYQMFFDQKNGLELKQNKIKHVTPQPSNDEITL
jgi:hypothetical protein